MGERNDTLKLIAILSMTIDHIGAVFFPHILLFRIIGRIAFPIFAYQTAVGMRFSKNIKKYIARLFLFSLVSQPFYFLLFGKGLNAVFTIFYGAVLIAFWRKDSYLNLVSAFLILFSCFIPLDYGFYGILSIFLFYILFYFPPLCLMIQTIFMIVYTQMIAVPAQLAGLISLVLIHKKWENKIVLPKYFFYIFYPLHLGILFAIKRLL